MNDIGERGWKRDDNFVSEALYKCPPCNGIYFGGIWKKLFSVTVDNENLRC